jgi:hypothetical protein
VIGSIFKALDSSTGIHPTSSGSFNSRDLNPEVLGAEKKETVGSFRTVSFVIGEQE